MPPGSQDIIDALEKRVRSNIEDHNWESLLEALLAAETYLSNKPQLLFEAFYSAGNYRLNKSLYFEAVEYYNKARKYNPTIVVVFDKIIESVDTFYRCHKDKLIKKDVERLLPTLKMLDNYYHGIPGSEPTSKITGELISSIAYRAHFVAPDTVEGPFTFRIDIMCAMLEKDVPMEQVKKEVGKFLVEILKKRLKANTNDKKTETRK